jgi:hypothetical protein
MGKQEGETPLGRPRCRWIDNIKTNRGEIEFGNVNWTDLAQDMDKWKALLNAVINLKVYKMLGNYPVASKPVASRIALSSL